jgi:hypothetical protein
VSVGEGVGVAVGSGVGVFVGDCAPFTCSSMEVVLLFSG